MIHQMIGHFEEKNKNVDENKEVSKKYEEVWEGVKKEIKTVNDSKKNRTWERFLKF